MQMISEYIFSRKKALFYGSLIGIATGVFNTICPFIDFSPSISLFGWVTAAIITTIFLHEGVHGLTAFLFGHKPRFGTKLPFFYTTFLHKLPRNHFIIVVLAPLILLNAVFITLYALNVLPTFTYLVAMINTVGAVGDVFMAVFLLRQSPDTFIQDTQNGMQVWAH